MEDHSWTVTLILESLQEKEGEEKWEERCRRIRMRREEEEEGRSEKEKWREKKREETGGVEGH